MAYDYLDRLATPGVLAAQAANGAAGMWDKAGANRSFTHFTEREGAFIAARDSFYIATVSSSGWPYVQHRGGPTGFLKVLDDRTLGFADYGGNRQYLTVGNLGTDDRASLFLMDYPGRARLKLLAHLRVHDLDGDRALADQLASGGRGRAERGITMRLEAFDWNCPQHITPRFTAAEVEAVTAPLRDRLAVLERENAALRAGAAADPA